MAHQGVHFGRYVRGLAGPEGRVLGGASGHEIYPQQLSGLSSWLTVVVAIQKLCRLLTAARKGNAVREWRSSTVIHQLYDNRGRSIDIQKLVAVEDRQAGIHEGGVGVGVGRVGQVRRQGQVVAIAAFGGQPLALLGEEFY